MLCTILYKSSIVTLAENCLVSTARRYAQCGICWRRVSLAGLSSGVVKT